MERARVAEHDGCVARGVELILRRVCEESGLDPAGPWEVISEVEVDVVEGVIRMSMELRLVGAAARLEVGGGFSPAGGVN